MPAQQPQPPTPVVEPPTSNPPIANPPDLEEAILETDWQFAENSSLEWYSNPNVDLPRHGRGGIQVTRPQGGASVPRVEFSPYLAYRLEPYLGTDPDALKRLELMQILIWRTAQEAYLQWTRHLDYDPGQLEVQIGDAPSAGCGHHAAACYVPSLNKVILGTDWITRAYGRIFQGTADKEVIDSVHRELFWVISHEAGHQFHYFNPNGIDQGCGGSSGCHAPYGEGSVIGYDALRGDASRYHVTEEDIRHVPNATWKEDDWDEYDVYVFGDNSSDITAYGVWIDHDFEVTGVTQPGDISQGNLDIVDEISALGYVQGNPSNTLPTGSATYSGTDNFLGVDMGEEYLGTLLRADANLRYTFSSNTMSLHINNFEAHYAKAGPATWHDHDFSNWGDFRYNLQCTSSGCSGDGVQTKWYPDTTTNDPSGWVGGVVDDKVEEYVGSFVAEKN